MEMMSERLMLIKERHRELILKRRQQNEEKEVDLFYDWDEEPDIFDDAVLARELRRQQDDFED